MVAARLATLPHGVKTADRPNGLSQSKVAEMLNVGERTIKRARVILDNGSTKLVAVADDDL